MILFVATTGPPFTGVEDLGTREDVFDIDKEECGVEKAVVPESCDTLELWLMV